MADDSYDEMHDFSADELTPGTTVGHYLIVERIGAGGMGEVYLADDTKLRRQVAIKVLTRSLAHDNEFKARFAREAHAAASLSHPNIVTVHDTDEHRGRPYIVMEYVTGKSLKDIITERSLSPEEIYSISLEIAEGLANAHAGGIVHRDLKSENILISDSGRVKILDFGLARLGSDEGLTQTGTSMGTVAYMSPEQARGEDVDHRTDLFSFGVVLYEMVCRRLPFTGTNIAAIINAVITSNPGSLEHENADLCRRLQPVFDRLIHKEAGGRYASAGEVAADFRRLQQGLAPSRPPARSGAGLWIPGAMAIVIIAVTAIWWFTRSGDQIEPSEQRKVVAVLPFEDLSAAGEEYFASGITDEITTQLTKLSGLRVISRFSSAQYAGSDKSLREIAADLGARYVLEGSLQWDRSDTARRIRLHTRLTDADDGTALWAERYVRVIDDIFAVQADIAEHVSAAMNVALLDQEQRHLSGRPTSDLVAYDYYLKGLSFFNGRDWEEAAKMFTEAVRIDSTFALGYAWLSRTHSLMYWWYLDRTDDRLELARAAAERSLTLDSGLAEGYLALGRYYYRGFLEYDRALGLYQAALRLQPGNSDLIFAIGSVRRRQGHWDEAIRDYREAATLDPRSRTKLTNLAQSLLLMRRFDETGAVLDRLLELVPDYGYAYELKARLLAFGYGNLQEAGRVISEAEDTSDPGDLIDICATVCLCRGQFDSALVRIESARYSDYYEIDSGYFFLRLAEIHGYRGDTTAARACYDSALTILQAQASGDPDEAQYQSMLGIAYAGLGRREEALEHGRKAVELHPIEQDALSGTGWLINLLSVHYLLGDQDEVAAGVKYLLTVPSEITVNYIKTYPMFRDIKSRLDVEDLK